MPASNQCLTWDMIAAEVAAGNMVWSGAAQSGNLVPTFGQWQAAITNDGANPDGYPANQIAPYWYLLAHAVTIMPPGSVTLTDIGGGEADASWTAPSIGLAPTSYDYQFTGGANTAVTNVTTTTAANTGYLNGQTARVQVRSRNGTLVSGWTLSNSVTMAVGGA